MLLVSVLQQFVTCTSRFRAIMPSISAFNILVCYLLHAGLAATVILSLQRTYFTVFTLYFFRLEVLCRFWFGRTMDKADNLPDSTLCIL